MKKFIIFLCMAAVLFSSFGSIGLSAEEPRNIENHLIVHYDFEGETLEEQLSDKATAGGSKENLILNSTQDENGKDLSYIKDGIAHIDMTGGNYLLSDFSTAEGMGTDLQGMTDITVFAKFSANGSGNQWADLFHVDNMARCFLTSSQDGIFDLRIRLGENCNGSGRLDTNSIGGSFFCEDGTGEGDVVCLAITFQYDAEAQSVVAEIYTSYDNGQTYQLKEKTWSNIETFYSVVNRMTLGKLYDARTGNRGYSFDIHEFRIYNQVLTQSEIQSVTGAENKGENPPVDPKPGENETKAPDTGSKPAETTAPANQDTTAAPTETDTRGSEHQSTSTSQVSTEEKGCGSSIGVAGTLSIAGIASLVGLVVSKKKRED